MVLDSKLRQLYEHYRIAKPEDWSNVLPGSILSLHGIGLQTLNHLRLHLACRGITLRGDRTPAYWQENLSEAKIGTAQVSPSDRAIVCPFRVAIDSREQHPFVFTGMTSDKKDGGRPMLVETVFGSLGNSYGDYAIDGLWSHCHVERKSKNDAHSTILGWGEHRERFEKTLITLAEIPSSAVVVECTLGELIKSAPSRGKKSAGENAKILHRQVMAWMDDYRVPWIFCDTRRLAEVTTFRWLFRYWRHHQADQKAASKQGQVELDSVLL